MLLIAHRGNTDGPNPKKENRPSYVVDAISRGFDAEVDIRWVHGRGLFLGHDKPQYKVSDAWIKQPGLWLHAKTVQTFELLLKSYLNVFYHTDEDVVLTTLGYIWVYPGITCQSRYAIIVQVGQPKPINHTCHGICTDYASQWKAKF